MAETESLALRHLTVLTIALGCAGGLSCRSSVPRPAQTRSDDGFPLSLDSASAIKLVDDQLRVLVIDDLDDLRSAVQYPSDSVPMLPGLPEPTRPLEGGYPSFNQWVRYLEQGIERDDRVLDAAYAATAARAWTEIRPFFKPHLTCGYFPDPLRQCTKDIDLQQAERSGTNLAAVGRSLSRLFRPNRRPSARPRATT